MATRDLQSLDLIPGASPTRDRDLLAAERRRIAARRQALADPAAPAPPGTADLVGLSLSGGGIRSATFNLGVLQALERYGVLRCVDYLSTVSGGGYIGTGLTWFAQHEQRFPFGTRRSDFHELGGRVLAHLRERGRFLAPGAGFTVWSLAASVLWSTLLNLAILLPILGAALYLLDQSPSAWLGWVPSAHGLADRLLRFAIDWTSPLYGLARRTGLVCLLLFAALSLGLVCAARFRQPQLYLAQRWILPKAGVALQLGALLIALGSLPLLHAQVEAWLPRLKHWVVGGVSLTGLLSLAGVGLRGGEDRGRGRTVLLAVAVWFVLLCVLLGLYGVAHRLTGAHWPWVLAAFAAALGLAWLVDVNHVSHHRFYRDRLMEAFMPTAIPDALALDPRAADTFLLAQADSPRAPYHLICANVVTSSSRDSGLRQRMGDSFVLSPTYCGSNATGFAPTGRWLAGAMTLATACAISGAAVDPNTLSTRSRPLSFLMSLLNLRLGYWAWNPARADRWSRTRPWTWRYLAATFAEMFGSGLSEERPMVHLNDGGHFENLGLYELVRRRCRYIVVCDAAADPDFTFFDLGRAVERVRVDFGARVEIDTRPLLAGDDGLSHAPVVHGAITYDDGSPGELLYLTTVMIDGVPEDVDAYRRQHPTFPDEGTGDQFFDEPQFEAYRELGFRVGQRACAQRSWDGAEALFGNWRPAGDGGRPA